MTGQVIGVGSANVNLDALAALIGGELAPHHISIDKVSVVEGGVLRLRAAISRGLEESEIVFVLGGLGATGSDVTKDAVSQALGRRLVPHEDTRNRLKKVYSRAGREMPEAVERICLFPEQSVVFPGVRGLIPGCAIAAGSQFLLLLPDSEKELLPMLQRSVGPYLERFFSGSVDERVVNVFGLTKEQAEVRLASKLESLRNPTIKLREREDALEIVVCTKASSRSESMALSTALIRQLTDELGDLVYGVDQKSLQNVLMGALTTRERMMNVAEVRTGGRLLKRLETVPDLPSRLDGFYNVDTLSEQAASLGIPERQLRKQGGCCALTAAQTAVAAVTENQIGVAVLCGGSIYDKDKNNPASYAAVCCDGRVWVQKLSHPKGMSRESMSQRACLAAVNLARLVTERLPEEYPNGNDVQTVLYGGKAPRLVPEPFTQRMPTAREKRREETSQKKKKPPPEKRCFLAHLFPWRGDTAAQASIKVVLLLAFFTLAGSGGYLGNYYFQAYSNRELSKAISQMYDAAWMLEDSGKTTELPSDYPDGYQPKFSSLYRVNNDVAGWIKIPDTQVNYPVVQYIDNAFYMRRDFYMKDNRHGVPWLEANCALEPQSDNYILYGHNMADGQMFGELNQYKPDQQGLSFLQNHSVLSMDDVYRDNDYKIFAVFICAADPSYGEVFYYNYYSDLSAPETFAEFVTEVRSRSFYHSDVDIQYGDQFLTLSTCSYEYGPTSDDAHVRTVVVARRVREGEKADGSDIQYSINESPRMPPGFTNHGGTGVVQTAAQIQEDIAVMAAAIRREQAAENTVTEIPDAEADMMEQIEAAQQADALALLDEAQAEIDKAAAEKAAAEAAEKAAAASKAASDAAAAKAASDAAASKAASDAAVAKASSDAAAAKAASDAAVAKAASDAAASKAASDAAVLAAQQSSSSRRMSSGSLMERSSVVPVYGSDVPESVESIEGEESVIEVDVEDESEQTESTPQPSGEGNTTLTIYANGQRISGAASEIIPMVVMNEMGSSFEPEALKAQAVAAYSFIRYENKSGRAPALAAKTPNSTVKSVCDTVVGQAVYYNGGLAFTPFFSTSAGDTIGSSDVWGGHYPYLVGTDSTACMNATNFAVRVSHSAEKVASRVRSVMGVSLSGDPSGWIQVLGSIGDTRYVRQVSVGGKTTSGRAFRESVMGLRSAAFEVDYDSGSGMFHFTTYGYGHGVGMSQMGAHYYAKQGWNYIQILEHYYTGTTVV